MTNRPRVEFRPPGEPPEEPKRDEDPDGLMEETQEELPETQPGRPIPARKTGQEAESEEETVIIDSSERWKEAAE